MADSWTPGPWRYVGHRTIEGLYEVETHMTPGSTVVSRIITLTTTEANANLQALAPEMAAFIADFVSGANHDLFVPRYDIARSLLARARGEA